MIVWQCLRLRPPPHFFFLLRSPCRRPIMMQGPKWAPPPVGAGRARPASASVAQVRGARDLKEGGRRPWSARPNKGEATSAEDMLAVSLPPQSQLPSRFAEANLWRDSPAGLRL
eukprot:2779866-Rhodomonas_salina.13